VPGKVLIADDSLKIQQQLTEMLKREDVEVVAVSNGEFAVRKLPEVKPGLVLADIFMPVRTGYEVCEFVKTSAEFSSVPVLLLASTIEPYDEAEAARVKSDGKIDKPITDEEGTLALIMDYLGGMASPDAAATAPLAGADEFAAAVPHAEEPAEPETIVASAPEPETIVVPPSEPEPEPQPAAKPEPIAFEESDSPMGFADLAGETPAQPEPAAAKPPSADTPFAEPGSGAAKESTPLLDLDFEIEEAIPDSAPALKEPAAPASAPPELVSATENAPADDESSAREVEAPELVAPWEMTEKPEGAPDIPEAGGWEGQDWKQPDGPILDSAEKLGPSPEEIAAPAEEAAGDTREAAAATGTGGAQQFSPDEMNAVFAETEAGAKQVMEEAAESAVGNAAADSGGGVSIDAMVEEVAKRVVEKLPPEVLKKLAETLAKEIVRPLAEKMVKDKLIE